MPSAVLDKNNIVETVTSFDPVVPEAVYIAEYDVSIIGKQYMNGEFVEPELTPDE